jgi:hypothetical protein
MKKKLFDYKWHQQQKAKLEYQKVKKIKEKAKKAPVSAAEELDYIKKLLNGEDVEDFGPKEVKDTRYDGISAPLHWKNGAPPLTKTSWATLTSAQMHLASQMSLSDYIDMMNGKGYYK